MRASGTIDASLWRHPLAGVALRGDELVTRLRATDRMRDPLLVARIEAVHRVLLRARVPHVLRVRAVERVTDDQLLLAYPAVRGPALVDVLRGGPLPVPRALAVLGHVCRSLGAAHAVGIEHLVLGPASIVFLRDDDPHTIAILDHGIAPFYEGCEQTMHVELHPVTPERVIGGGNERSQDVYLVGCLAYWMLTGEPPFPADDLATLRRRHAIEDARRLQVDGLAPHVADAVARALEKDPDDRFATVAELEAALASPPDASPVSERASPPADPIPTTAPESPAHASLEKRVVEPAFVFAPGRRREDPRPLVVRDGAATVEVAPGSLLRATALALRRPPTTAPARRELSGAARLVHRIAVAAGLVSSLALAAMVAFAGRAPAPLEPIEAASVIAPRVRASGASAAASPPVLDDAPLPPVPSATGPLAAAPPRPTEDRLVSGDPARVPEPARERAVAPRVPATAPEHCALTRRAAVDARRAHDWSGLLRHTARASCWNDADQHGALRIKALMELGRFSECAELGRRVARPEAEAWTRLCSKRADLRIAER